MVKTLPTDAGDARDVGQIPELGRSPGEGNGNSLQYSCLQNPIDRGSWQATVNGVAESPTRWVQMHDAMINDVEHIFMCLLTFC